MWAGLPLAIGLSEIDVLLARVGFRRDVFLPDILRIARRDVHGDVVDQFLEVLGARHEIAFAVHLDQHANLAAGMNVVGHRAFAGHARRFLGCDRHALFAQQDNRLLQVAFGFGQGLFAIHHGRSGFFAELFYLGCRNVCHSSTH